MDEIHIDPIPTNPNRDRWGNRRNQEIQTIVAGLNNLSEEVDLLAEGVIPELTDAGMAAVAESGGEFTAALTAQTQALLEAEVPDLIAGVDALAGWGHSMMAAGWILDAAADLGVPGFNGGASGESSSEVALRQGGLTPVLTFPGGTIPADTSEVPVTIQPASTWRLGFAYGGTLTLPDGTEIPGRLEVEAAGTYTFNRTTAGDPITVTTGVFRRTAADAYRGYANVYWAGVNNLSTDIPVRRLMDVLPDIAVMERHQSAAKPRTLILTDLPTTTQPKGSSQHTALLAERDALVARWGSRLVIDVNTELTAYGLDLVGINPTALDRANIANEVAPDSLRSDGFHLTTAGYTVVRQLVVQRLRELGWFPAGGRPLDVPGQVTGVAVGTPTSSTVPLTWTVPAGTVRGYRVNYRKVGATPWLLGAISATASATVEGLTEGTAYEFQVIARNEAGPAVASATATASTTGSAPVVLFSDSFNRANASLSGSTADGSLGGSGFTWGAVSTEIRVIDNQVGRSSGTTVRLPPGPNVGSVGMRVQAKATVLGGVGLVVAADSTLANAAYLTASTNGSVQFALVNSGSTAAVGTTSAAGLVNQDDLVAVKISADGLTLTAYCNDVPIHTYTLTGSGPNQLARTGTYAGLRIPNTSTARWDDFIVFDK